ncbi:L-gulonolactone oxidase 3 [Lactuca sativa]|uniref:L-gulonolactone oxidase 3 n=1 Tax=Lactuca sativa TaxID=4236 RepID=UPI000CC1AD0B|nr:L-gulonolactone oxidase 3 [Lactuca sativa]
MASTTIVVLFFLILWVSTTTAYPPPPPIQCTAGNGGCTLQNSYGVWGDRKDCRASNVIYPTTQQQLLSIVANAAKNKLKLKVVSKFSHTIPKFACPAAGNTSVLISTQNYNSGIDIDVSALTVTADAGVSLRDLINKVEDAGLSLVAAPYWEGVSVGGVISTGAHGSSWWGKGGAVHDHVMKIDMVVPAKENEGFSKILHLDAKNQLFNAAKVSLGTLGIISKVTLSLVKGFKRSITFNFTDDGGLEDAFMSHAKAHEFGDITWYPSKHTAVYRYDDRVPMTTKGDGTNDFLGFQSNLIVVSKSTRATERKLEKAKNVKGKCAMASSFITYKKLIANGLKNNLIFTGYPVIGRQGKMQTSGSCLYSSSKDIANTCAWDPRIDGLFFYETTAIFPVRKFMDFILDVKKLRDLNPDNFCGVDIYNGLLIRFIKASTAYLGQSSDSVVVDFNYYRADSGSTPRLNQDVMEEVEQMAFLKYGARPHWAKNRKVAFSKVEKKYEGFNGFVAAKTKMDPENMFSSEWSDELLFGKKGVDFDGCGLEGECVCSEHRHCSPTNGYFCRPGLVYKEARVCRYSPSSLT